MYNLKILFISGREPAYSRNSTILKGLRMNNVEIIECTDSSKNYFVRYIKVLIKFLLKRKNDFDIIFIGFLGQPIVPIIRRLSNKPIMFDVFISMYDTICFDRKKLKPESVGGKFLHWLDKHSCDLADKVLLDTNAHIDYFVEEFHLDRKKMYRVSVGTDDKIFYPKDDNTQNSKFMVEFHGSFLPLQGVQCIVKAAKILENDDIYFRIIGKGYTYKDVLKLSKELETKNITFIDPVKYEELPENIARADICLGIFGETNKARRVIPNKVFETIAMKKPLITMDSQAVRELLVDKKNCLLCDPNPESLAGAILELKNDKYLREKIADNGYIAYIENATPNIIGRQITNIIQNMK